MRIGILNLFFNIQIKSFRVCCDVGKIQEGFALEITVDDEYEISGKSKVHFGKLRVIGLMQTASLHY